MIVKPVLHRARGRGRVFLHFMNREAFRSLGARAPDSAFVRSFLLLLIFTETDLFTTASFVIEDDRFASSKFAFLRRLFELDILRVVSDSPSIEEHVHRRQLMYANDRARYKVYFESGRDKSIWIRPTLLKSTSTSASIRQDLNILASSPPNLFKLPLPDVDLLGLSRLGISIRARLKQAPEAGVTLSLFGDHGSKSSRRIDQLLIGRVLSLLHLKDYLAFTKAEIISGFPGLAYFDVAATGGAALDLDVLESLLSLCTTDGKVLHSEARQLTLIDEAIKLRQTELLDSVVDSARLLIHGASYHYQCTSTRGGVADALRQLCSGVLVPGNSVSVAEIRSSLIKMLQSAERRSKFFREYIEMTELINRDRLTRLLIVCATDTEMSALVECARDQLEEGFALTIEQSGGTTIYAFGVLSKTQVFACQVEAGDEGSSSLRLALSEVFETLRPDYVVLAGICYGLRPDKQKIGDIVVAKQLQAFNLQKRIDIPSSGSQIILRGPKAEVSPTLLDRSRAAKQLWSGVSVEHGLFMSGSVLSDDESFVKTLLSLQPEARAGEMEGHGVYAVCQREGIQWIMIKAICDWGYNKTDENQVLAAQNVMKFVLHMVVMGGLSSAAPNFRQ